MNEDLKTWAETTTPRDVRAMNDQEQINLAERIFNWQRKYEPESRDVQTPLEAAAMSIAISLKRIADHLRK